jgi:hypothetical protein
VLIWVGEPAENTGGDAGWWVVDVMLEGLPRMPVNNPAEKIFWLNVMEGIEEQVPGVVQEMMEGKG